METNKNIQDNIDNTFEAINKIETVNVSPFFKDKTMQRLFAEKEKQPTAWFMLIPKMQLAALVMIIALNGFALIQISASKYDDNVNDFAESYGLETTEDNTLFN